MSVRGKVAVVTGAGSGIGRATALALGAEGARVAAVDVNGATAAETARLIAEASGDSTAFTTDVTSSEQVRAMVDGVVSRYGTIDVLVNNAGLDHGMQPIVEMPEELW